MEEFVKKESKIDDYKLEAEECTVDFNPSNGSNPFIDEFDDALYHINVQVIPKLKATEGNSVWDKGEEERIKKRLEKNAYNTFKYKYNTQTSMGPSTVMTASTTATEL